ncbi:MAG: membrane protein insertase YidC, partial [Lysobacterales bacterium]
SARTPSATHIVVNTDVLRVEIDPEGGNLVRVDLIDYALSNKQRDQPVTLLSDATGQFYVAQTGLVATGGTVPDHKAEFTAARTRYTLPAGSDKIEVPLTWQQNGVTVTKTWTFARGSYRIGLAQYVANAGAAALAVNAYGQLQREAPLAKRSYTDPSTYSFSGAAWWSNEERFEKAAFDKYTKEPLKREITGGWAALLQHHFVAALIPPAAETFAYSTSELKPAGEPPRYLIRALGPTRTVAPGASATLPLGFYIGPKLQDHLGEVAPGLNHTVDYGKVTFLAEPLFWLLSKIHKVVGNWGWSIVLLTVLIKLAFYKLTEAQYRSFARMRKFQPRLAALKERHGDDKEKLNRAMVELYQKEKINPMGGCLPMLVQIPVFIALYWVLIESVELRHAPWILWIHSLTDRDPYFVLPVLNGLAMFATQKLSPTSPGLDPMQAKMFQMMPVIMSVMFAFFPAGLVLYWTVNGVLGLIQQYVITKRIEASEAKH